MVTDAVPGTIPDAAERAQALDTKCSWIVEAPAGSGKTGLLIQRFLKLLATADEPEEVLALTFTQKATGEMRERVLKALRLAADPLAEPASSFEHLTWSLAAAVLLRDRERGWQLLGRPHRLNIRTIDSLCSAVARAVPLLSGGIGTARPVNDAAPLYARAARAVMLRLGGDDAALNHAIETVLLHRDGDLLFCERVLAEMLGTREQWGRLVPRGAGLHDQVLDTVVLPRLNRSLERTLCAALTTLHSCFPESELAVVAEVARDLAFAEGYGGRPSAFAPCALLPGVPGPEAQHHNYWLLVAKLLLTKGGTWRKSFPKDLIEAVLDKPGAARLKTLIRDIGTDELAELLHAVNALPPAEYPPEQWKVTKALFRLLQHALVELELLFAREGVCDFTAVALAARAALQAEGGEAQVALGTRLCHLLVDEMQDTSTGQYELLETLTAGWDGVGQTVFLVGDPKQSIYLFRQARVELFQQCLHNGRLGEIEVGALRLSSNFRSGSRLVGEFNDIFAGVFTAPEMAEGMPEGDVTYTAAAATQPEASGEGVAWRVSLLPRPEDTAAGLRQRAIAVRREAEDVAVEILRFRRRSPGSSVAVLTRARSHVAEIAHALRSHSIAYRAVDMEALGERREVLDVLAITRALLYPADRTAWLAVLRAPWCGAGLTDLHRLAAGDQPERSRDILRLHLRERLPLLQPAVRERVERTLDVMDAALQHTGAESLGSRVERTWRSLGGDACAGAAGGGNVRQFFRVLDSMEAENEPVNRRTLDRRLDRLFAEPGGEPGAVDIMTIHKAKGLEWDLVLVPGMHRVGAQDRYPALDWLEMAGSEPEDGTRDVLLAPLPARGGDAGKMYTFIRDTRRGRANAELKRVLYVAATRARTSLHLFAWPEAKADGTAMNGGATLLKAAGPAAAARLASLQQLEIAKPDSMREEASEAEVFDLAAAGDAVELPARTPVYVERLPAGYDPLRVLRAASPGAPAVLHVAGAPRRRFERPDGSFGARVVGTTIHAFLERLTKAFADTSEGDASTAAAALMSALPSWRGAIRASLRTGGLPPDAAERAVDTVLRALRNTLTSVDGLWLLLPHADAASEGAWHSVAEGSAERVRLDRSFFAGPAPRERGRDTLWIIDAKTGDRDGQQDEFVAEERERYRTQLERYARLRLRSLPPGTPVMLALFFPLMGRLESWPFIEDGPPEPTPEENAAAQQRRRPVQLAMFG